MLYHASSVKDISYLEPRISNHGTPLIYFSTKRENVLVYLCNAVEKYCKETGFEWNGTWTKWGPYGFTGEKILHLKEYYPNAIEETYRGVSAYIYHVENNPDARAVEEIPYAMAMDHPVKVSGCEYIPDAYEEIVKNAKEGKIVLRRYEELSDRELQWIHETVLKEYGSRDAQPDYKHFLKGRFSFLR